MMLKSSITSTSLLRLSNKFTACLGTTHQRFGSGVGYGGTSYIKSETVGPPEKYTKVEKSYDEWKYVEKLLANAYVPNPPDDPSKVFPSGWKAPDPLRPDAQYCIPRNKNHMIPVHIKHFKKERGLRRWTMIKKVEGNIWALEKDIGNYLKEKYPQKTIKTWVNESWRTVFVHSDYEDDVKEWILQQGF